MHKTLLVIRREYLERVKTKSFVVSTVLLPAMMAALMILPSKMATMKTAGTKKVVVASADNDFAETVKAQMLKSKDTKYEVEIDNNVSSGEKTALQQKLEAAQIDGFLWATPEAVQSRQIS